MVWAASGVVTTTQVSVDKTPAHRRQQRLNSRHACCVVSRSNFIYDWGQ
jgi:hypothetical protein